MKRIAIIFCIVSVVSAATQITYNISNAYGSRMLAAQTEYDGAHCIILIERKRSIGPHQVQDYTTRYEFDFPERNPQLTDPQYIKRRVGRIVDAFTLAHEQKLLIDAKATYNANAPSIDVNEPNGIE